MPEGPHEFSRAAEEMIGAFRRVPYKAPRGMKRRPTRPMAPLIEEVLAKYQIGRHSTEQVIRDHWPEIVGAANAAYSHPVRLERSRTLLVLVSHSVVRSELFLHRVAILEKIRQLPGCDQVSQLNLAAG
jgi:Dna[CI] antecedent, DciA